MKQKSHFFLLAIFFVLAGCMSTKQNSVNQKAYLGTKRNASDIYNSQTSNSFYSPFNAVIDPMDKLMLIDFEGDSIYETFELQTYDDARGKGATVILYGRNGENDVYFTDSVFENRKLFKGNIYENKNIVYSLKTTPQGLEAQASVTDKYGRKIVVSIKETENTNELTSLLAPVGGVIKTFTFLPVFYMANFDFVKQHGSTIEIKIDNKTLSPKKIPILLNGTFVYIARYSSEPVIARLNNDFDGELKPLTPSNNNFTDGKMSYELTRNNGHIEIAKVVCTEAHHKIGMTFSPAIPDLIHIKNDVILTGRFSIEIDSITGIIAGEYMVKKYDNKTAIVMKPLKAYSPMFGKLWILNYIWNAQIKSNPDGSVIGNTKWIISENY